jgi:hypothetical protein
MVTDVEASRLSELADFVDCNLGRSSAKSARREQIVHNEAGTGFRRL